MKPLFMWAGGKTRLIKKYEDMGVMPESFDKFIEPFVGAGAMFIWAYKKNPDAKFVINDSNESIMAIYKAIKKATKSFISHMDSLSEAYLPLSKDNRKAFYYELRRQHAYD